MDDKFAALKGMLYGLADAATFLFTKPLGLSILVAVLLLGAGTRLWTVVSGRRLAAKAAGEEFGLGSAAGAALRELVSLGVRAGGVLPAIAGLAVALALLVGVADATRAVDDYVAGQKRIAELSATVRNLDRRYKAIDVSVEDVTDGRIKATLSFYDYRDPKSPAKTQGVDIAGKELFVDAIVCNFDFSEIASGKAVNLAIPYRVFSDEVSESQGIALGLFDDKGIPLMYSRSADELYGIGPEVYGARLAELMASMRTDEAARGAGIARSLYGDAVHREAKKGDSFSVWVEQTGGITIKDADSF
jgi:hypothetical protein